MSTIPYSNFTKGELSPELQARIDTNQYTAGVKRARNFIIQRYGGLSFRPGFRYIGEVDTFSEKLKYIPFQYNIEQSYVLAIGNTGMRLLSGGGFLIEENVRITAITKDVQAQITEPYHGYVVGERVYFSGIVGMTQLNGQVGTVTVVVDANNYKINIDTSTNYGTFVSSDGTLRVGAPAPPPATPAPPPVPAVPPADPVTTAADSSGSGGSGGSGGNIGELRGQGDDGLREY